MDQQTKGGPRTGAKIDALGLGLQSDLGTRPRLESKPELVSFCVLLCIRNARNRPRKGLKRSARDPEI